MAEAGDLPQDFLADAAILYCSLSGIFPEHFSDAFLLVLHARTYFYQQDHALTTKYLHLFLEPSSNSPPPVIGDFSACMPWLDEWMVENAVLALAFYASQDVFFEFAVHAFVVHLVRTHVDLAVAALQVGVVSFVAEPDINYETFDIAFQICHICAGLLQQDALLVLKVLDDLVLHFREVFTSSQTNWDNFHSMLWIYCRGLWEAGSLTNALAVAEEAVQYTHLSPSANTMSWPWHGLHTLILIDMDRVGEAQTVLCDPNKRLNCSDSHWLVKYLILLQTGRRGQASSLLERNVQWDGTLHAGFRFLFSDLVSIQLDLGQTQRALDTAERVEAKFRELPWPLRIEVAYVRLSCGRRSAEEGIAAAQEAATIYAGPWQRGDCPRGYRSQEFTSKAFYTLSHRLAAAGQADDALQNAEKAVIEYRELVSRAVHHIPSLASGLRNLATRFWDTGRQDESIAALREAISLLRGVFNNHSHLLTSFCDVLEQLTEYLSGRGEAEASLAAASECAEIRERLELSPVSLEPLLEIETETEIDNTSDCEEIISQDAVLAIAAQTDGQQVQQTAGVAINPLEDTSVYESEVAAEKIGSANVTKTHSRFEVKIELKSPPLDVVGWILLGALGIACAGLALALARK
ncbi:hypothetical protein C8J57DRAFT_1710672 [Mycena rebaudengoi]|nr:hypothetical protein C8J57DRAFT_1710672 [Mycena rebaudengoi]